MGLEAIQQRLMGDDVMAKTLYKTASYSMKVNDNVIVCTTGSVSDITLTLPPVVQAAGKFYSIYLPNGADGGKDVVIQDQDDSVDWADITMADEEDGRLLFSDGRIWWTVGTKT